MPSTGYAACQAATTNVYEGCVGAGTGATVAKMGGPDRAHSRAESAPPRRVLEDGTIVAALLAVNAVGAIYDPHTGQPLAEPRTTETPSPAGRDEHHHWGGGHDRATRRGGRESPGHARP